MSTKVVYRQRYQEGDEPVPGYRLAQFLGSGAMGEVWKASAPGQMVCALKIINLDQTGGKKEFRSLQRVKAINHPNLVPIHCIWLKDDQGNILADEAVQEGMLDSHPPTSAPPRSRETMTLAKADTDPTESRLKGTMAWDSKVSPSDSGTYHPAQLLIAMGLGQSTLFKRLEDCQERGEKGIPEKELLRYLTQSADAIDFLNQTCQIIHCDIKPQNILIVGNAAQVCDFGLARRMADARKTTAAFTAYYAPLELITDNEPTQTTDQYSLAITYIELKVGKPPYESETQGRIIKDKITGHMDLKGLGPNETEVILKGAATHPTDRYGSCAEMVRALSEALEADRKQVSPWVGMLRYVAMFLLLAVLGGGGYAAYLNWPGTWWPNKQPPLEKDPVVVNGGAKKKPPERVAEHEALEKFNTDLGKNLYLKAADILPQVPVADREGAALRLAKKWWEALGERNPLDKGHHDIEELHEFLRTFHPSSGPPPAEVTQALAKRTEWLAALTKSTAKATAALNDPSTAADPKMAAEELEKTTDELKDRLVWLSDVRKEHDADPTGNPWTPTTAQDIQQLERAAQLSLARALVCPTPLQDEPGLKQLLAAYDANPAGWTTEAQQQWRFCRLVLDSQQPAADGVPKVLPELERIVSDQKKGLDGWEAGRVEKIKDAWLDVLPDTLDQATKVAADKIWMGPARFERGLKRLREVLVKKDYSEARRLLTSLSTDFPEQAPGLLTFDVELTLRANQPLADTFWPQLATALAQPDNRDALLTLLEEQAPSRPKLVAPAVGVLTKLYNDANADNKNKLKGKFAALLTLHLDQQWAQPTINGADLLKLFALYRELLGEEGKPSPRLTAWLVELQLEAEPEADRARQAAWKRDLVSAKSRLPSGEMSDLAAASYIAFVSARVEGRDSTGLRQVAGELTKLVEPRPTWLTEERRRVACELLVEGALATRLPRDEDLALSSTDKYQDSECRPWLALAENLGPLSWRGKVAWVLVLSCNAQEGDEARCFGIANEVLTKHQAELKPLPMLRQVQLARGRAALGKYDKSKAPADLDLAVADHAAALEGLFQFRSPLAKVSDAALYKKILGRIVPVLMTKDVLPSNPAKAAQLLAIFGRLVDRSVEVRRIVGAAEPKLPMGEQDDQVLALRAAYRALDRSTRWKNDIDAQVVLGKILLQLPDNDPLATGLQDKLDKIDKELGGKELGGDASIHPGALVLQASIILRRGRRLSDLNETRKLFVQALEKCDRAVEIAGGIQDELLAQLLEVRSDIHLNLAYHAPVPATVHARIKSVEKYKFESAATYTPSRGWHLKVAAEDAEAATKIKGRPNPENAFNAWGNSLEDQAYYLRWDVNATFERALSAFDDGYAEALNAGDAREALCLFNLGRCQVRYAEDKYVDLGDRAGTFATAADNLRSAIKRWGSYDDRKSEAYYWLSRALFRQSGSSEMFLMPEDEAQARLSIDKAAAECAARACALAKDSGRYEWADFVLHRSELAIVQIRNNDARTFAEEVVQAYRSGGLTQGRGGVIPVGPDQAFRAVCQLIEVAPDGPAKFVVIKQSLDLFANQDAATLAKRVQLHLFRIMVALEAGWWDREIGRWDFMKGDSQDDLAEAKRIILQLSGPEQSRLHLEQTVLEGRWHLSTFRNARVQPAVRAASGKKALQLLTEGLRLHQALLDDGVTLTAEQVERRELGKLVATPAIMGMINGRPAQVADIPAIENIRNSWGGELYLDQRLFLHLIESKQCREALGATLKLLVDAETDPTVKAALGRQGVECLQPLLALRGKELNAQKPELGHQQLDLTRKFVEFFMNAR